MIGLGLGVTNTASLLGATIGQAVQTVTAVIGQSENVVGWLSNESFDTSNDIYPAVLPGVDVQVAVPRLAEKTSANAIRTVTQAAADAFDISPGAVALANVWHLGSGGEPLRVAGLCVSGTGMTEMMDENDPARITQDDLDLIALAETAWGTIQSVHYNWYVAEAAAAHTLWENRSAHFFGVNADGTDYDFAAGPLDYCLVDITGRGFGMLSDTAKVHLMYPGQNHVSVDYGAGTLFASQDTFTPTLLNYLTDGNGVAIVGRVESVGVPAYQERRDFLVEARIPAANVGLATISPALGRLGDYQGGVKLDQGALNAQVGTHPALQDGDGQILYGSDVAASILIAEGHAQATRLNRVEIGPGGAYADFIFDLPTGATLTTQRILNSETVASPRPHQQEVMGFVIRRAGDTALSERPLFRTDNTDPVAYPVAYRGTAVIHDAATGVVRVTPDQAFGIGDSIRFGADGGYGCFCLHGFLDYDAKLHRDGLRAYEARFDDGTQYGYPGIPVVNQEVHTIQLDLSAYDRVALADGNDVTITGPDVGPGVTELTMLFEGRVADQPGFGTKGILSLNSNGLRLEADTRASVRRVQIRMEDGTGVSLTSTNLGDGSLPPSNEDCRLMITATQADGAGNFRVALYVNDALVGSEVVGAQGATPLFQSNQTYAMLQGNIGFEVARIAIWEAYSADGSLPTTGQVIELTGDAAYWNSGLPAGWAKVGTALFTDV